MMRSCSQVLSSVTACLRVVVAGAVSVMLAVTCKFVLGPFANSNNPSTASLRNTNFRLRQQVLLSYPSPSHSPSSSRIHPPSTPPLPSQQAPANWLRVSHPEPSRLARPRGDSPCQRRHAHPSDCPSPASPETTPAGTYSSKDIGPGLPRSRKLPPPSKRTESGELGPRLRPTVRTSLLSFPKTGQTLFFLGHIHTDAPSSGEEARQTSRCWAGKSSPETKPQGTSRVFD